MNIIISLLILNLTILIHEFGHYFFAKLCKIKIDEFSIGFGGTLIKKNIKGTKYTLRYLPFGGYLKFNEDEYIKEHPIKQFMVSIGGIVFNLLAAIVLCIVVVSLNKASFGIETIKLGFSLVYSSINAMIETITIMFSSSNIMSNLSGPIGIISESSQINGFFNYIVFFMILNLNLGICNAIPFPMLDGSKAVISLFKILVNKKHFTWELYFHGAGALILILLTIFVTFKDIFKIIF